jgi:hypothetical protein
LSTSIERAAAKVIADQKRQKYEREYRAYRRSVDPSFVKKENLHRQKYNEITRLSRLFAKLHSKDFDAFVMSEQRPMYAEISRPTEVIISTPPTVAAPHQID